MPESEFDLPQVTAGQMFGAALFVLGFVLGGAGLAFARKNAHLSRGLEIAALALFAAATLVVIYLAVREAWLRGRDRSGDPSQPAGAEMRLPQDAGSARGLPWYWAHEVLGRGGARLYLSGRGRGYIALLMGVLIVGSLLFAAVGLNIVWNAPARADWHAWTEAVAGPLAALFFLTAFLGALGGTEWRITRNTVELSTSYLVWVRVKYYSDAVVELAPGRFGPLVFSEPRNVNLIAGGRRIRLAQGNSPAEGLRLATLIAYHAGWPLYAEGDPLPSNRPTHYAAGEPTGPVRLPNLAVGNMKSSRILDWLAEPKGKNGTAAVASAFAANDSVILLSIALPRRRKIHRNVRHAMPHVSVRLQLARRS